MSHYFLKKTFILIVYLVIIGGMGFLLYWTHRPLTPVCSSSYTNAAGKVIGCGMPCAPCPAPQLAPIQVIQSGFIPTLTDTYDAYVEIQNTNAQYGASPIAYTLSLIGANGAATVHTSGTTFILPNQSRYVIVQQMSSPAPPARVQFTIDHISWEQFSRPITSQVVVNSKNFQSPSASFPVVLGGTLLNQGLYTLNTVELDVLVRDSQQQIIGVAETSVNTVTPSQTRYFQVGWPKAFAKTAVFVDVYPEVDILSQSAVIQQYGAPQKFQQF